MNNIDIKKEFSAHYKASSKKITVIDVQAVPSMMIDGNGNPTVEEFKMKSKVLRLLAKEIKEEMKQHNINFIRSPLEGLWDTYDNRRFDVTRREMIDFTLMLPLPSGISFDIVETCKERLFLKTENPYVMSVYCKVFEGGKSVQMLHKGAYNTEINTTKCIMEYIMVENMKLVGWHHEIYLNNPELVEPEDLKTIVRYSIENA